MIRITSDTRIGDLRAARHESRTRLKRVTYSVSPKNGEGTLMCSECKPPHNLQDGSHSRTGCGTVDEREWEERVTQALDILDSLRTPLPPAR